jgi:hypothetical protein
VKAQDVVDIMATPEMKKYLGSKTGITLRTGQRWLHNMEWRYGKATKGMYIDGHERADVVEYRKGFLSRMNEYSKRMTTYDQDGNILSMPTGIDLAAGIYPLIKVTQDESTFTMYDRRRTKWDHEDAKQPEAKGEGPSLMVSGMLTEEWGELRHVDRCVETSLSFLIVTLPPVNPECCSRQVKIETDTSITTTL